MLVHGGISLHIEKPSDTYHQVRPKSRPADEVWFCTTTSPAGHVLQCCRARNLSCWRRSQALRVPRELCRLFLGHRYYRRWPLLPRDRGMQSNREGRPSVLRSSNAVARGSVTSGFLSLTGNVFILVERIIIVVERPWHASRGRLVGQSER